MANVKVYNIEGKEVGTIELNDAIFGVEVNEHLMHMAVVQQLANKRQGTQKAKTRSEVSGGGRKPWRQKGTGHARQGSTRAPQWTGGGVVFAPKPRDFSKKVNKQAKQIALLSALSQKLAQNEIVVLDKFEIASAKTKDAQSFLNAFKFDGSVLVVGSNNGENELKATNNIEKLNVILIDEIELALHPSAIKRLVDFAKEIAKQYNVAIYFSTHSLEIINSLPTDNLFYLPSLPYFLLFLPALFPGKYPQVP